MHVSFPPNQIVNFGVNFWWLLVYHHTIMRKIQSAGSGLIESDSKEEGEIGLSWLLALSFSLNCITDNIRRAGIIPE